MLSCDELNVAIYLGLHQPAPAPVSLGCRSSEDAARAPASVLMQCHKKGVLRDAQRSEPLHSLVFKPFQCRTPRADDLAEGFAGHRSSLATDGKDVPFQWKCSAIPFFFF